MVTPPPSPRQAGEEGLHGMFNGNMLQVFGTLCSFSSIPFLKQLEFHVSANSFQLKFPGMKFFSFILGVERFFLEDFKVFCVVLMKDKSSHIKK